MLEQARLWLDRRRVQRGIFPTAVFRESCWDIMLMCFVSELRRQRLCIKEIHNQLAESHTALLRRIDELEEADMLRRHRDEGDGRRTTVHLTPAGASAMTRFFTEM